MKKQIVLLILFCIVFMVGYRSVSANQVIKVQGQKKQAQMPAGTIAIVLSYTPTGMMRFFVVKWVDKDRCVFIDHRGAKIIINMPNIIIELFHGKMTT